jgi:hypothetical protein
MLMKHKINLVPRRMELGLSPSHTVLLRAVGREGNLEVRRTATEP